MTTLSDKLSTRLLHLSHTECERCHEEIKGIEEDVKEFIKELKSCCEQWMELDISHHLISKEKVIHFIDKLAGEKLI